MAHQSVLRFDCKEYTLFRPSNSGEPVRNVGGALFQSQEHFSPPVSGQRSQVVLGPRKLSGAIQAFAAACQVSLLSCLASRLFRVFDNEIIKSNRGSY